MDKRCHGESPSAHIPVMPDESFIKGRNAASEGLTLSRKARSDHRAVMVANVTVPEPAKLGVAGQ